MYIILEHSFQNKISFWVFYCDPSNIVTNFKISVLFFSFLIFSLVCQNSAFFSWGEIFVNFCELFSNSSIRRKVQCTDKLSVGR